MRRTAVKSSQITSVGHDSAKNILEVEFKHDGSVYQYTGVSKEMFEQMLMAESVGSWHARNIKKFPARYPFIKITENAPAAPPIEDEGDWAHESGAWSTPDGVQGTVTGRLEQSRPVLRQLPVKSIKRTPDLIQTDITNAIKRTNEINEVVNNDQYVTAAEFLKGIKKLQTEVDDCFDDIIASAHRTHKLAIEKKKAYYHPLEIAEKLVKGLMDQYTDQLEQARIAEENRIKKEHEERVRAQAEDENLKRAQELLDMGDVEGAAAVVDGEVEVPVIPVHVPSALPKVEGVSSRKSWEVVRVDLMALVKAVVEGKAPIEALQSNDKFLGQQARSYKKTGELFPGVWVQEVSGTAASGK